MYGEQDVTSAYSLSGHVSLAISPVHSVFESRRAARFLLQSLELTFEGQSELISPKTGYNGLRLCAVTQELVPAEPIEINNAGQESSSEPTVWNVVFNLTVPGWLPASTLFGQDEEGGIRYFLHANAKLSTLPDTMSTPWSLSTICSSFRSKQKFLRTTKDISVHRFANRPTFPTSKDSLYPPISYTVNTRLPPPKEDDTPDFPREVLSKIQVLASVPEFVDVSAGTFPLTIRLRTSDIGEEERKKIQVSSFVVEFEQIEKYKSASISAYQSRYPIPSIASQPPNLPLRNAHPISSIFQLGLYDQPINPDATIAHTFSILASGESARYNIAGNPYVFAAGTGASDASTWYTIDTLIPFDNGRQPEQHWAGPQRLRASGVSPQFTVRHQLHVSLICKYDVEGGTKKSSERLKFTLPVQFVDVAPLERSASPASFDSMASSPVVAAPFSDSFEPRLPAYSHLYHPNGDRKIDYSIPLPLYTPKPVESPPDVYVRPNCAETKITDVIFGIIPRQIQEA